MADIKSLFKMSPFEPLREHLAEVMKCVAKVRPMFEAVQQGKYEELESLANEVFKAEHQADVVKSEIRGTIPRTFFLPVYRGDLLAYLKLQDNIADAAEDLAVLLTIKRLDWPVPLEDAIFEYVDKVLCVCDKTKAMSDHLPTLVEQDLGDAAAKKTLEMVRAIEHAEWEADRINYGLAKALFAEEDNMKATDIFLWSRVFGKLGKLANEAENIGDRLRRMLAAR